MTITATDARGATITIGDVVTYVTGGRYPEIMTAEVLDIKVKVKLGNRDFVTSSPPLRTGLPGPAAYAAGPGVVTVSRVRALA